MAWLSSYTDDPTYNAWLSWALVFALAVFVISWFIASPYGRFASSKYGISVGPRLGWFLMELARGPVP
jgi:3-oxo-5-alpha-steroid 4-dehydrogenase 1